MTESLNPYSPPRAEVASVEALRPTIEAGKGRRLGTLLVDYALFLLCSFMIGIGVVLIFGDAGLEALEAIPDFLLGLLIMSSYYIVFEGFWARTPGKWLFGTMVVSESGGKPSIGQIIGRTLCRFLPFEPFSFLGERGWHDSIPKTRVVMARVV